MRILPLNFVRWPKGRRRFTMFFIWPLVLIESVINAIIYFPRDFYRCWNAEKYRGE